MKYIASLIVAVALMIGSAVAQNGVFAPYVEGTVTSAPGNNNPSFNVGVGIESSSKHFLLDANGLFNSANSLVGAGYTGTLTGSAYYKLLSHVLVGGGANWVINTNGFSAKNFFTTARESANPFVGAGLQVKKVRLLADYQLPGRDALPNSRLVTLQGEYFATKHIRLVASVATNSYFNGTPAAPVQTGGGESVVRASGFSVAGQRVDVTQAGGGVKFVF